MQPTYNIDPAGKTIWPDYLERVAQECGSMCVTGLYRLEEIFSLQAELCEPEDRQDIKDVLNVIGEALVLHLDSEVPIVPSLLRAKEAKQLYQPENHNLPLAS